MVAETAQIPAELAAQQPAEQEMPDWLLADRKATIALKGAEYLVSQYRMEEAKIASDALGPQDSEEQQACMNVWIYLDKAVSVYKQAADFLEESQVKVKACIKEMELEVKSQPEAERETLLGCIRNIKGFKTHQAEKIDEVRAQIDRIHEPRKQVIEWLKQVAKDQDKTCEELMTESMKALDMEVPSTEELAEALKEFGQESAKEEDAKTGGYPAAESPTEEKKKKKKGKKN